MTDEKKEYCRVVMLKEGFNGFHPACEEPWYGEEVEILYEDMDGNPCRGTAKKVHDNIGYSSWYKGVSPSCIEGNRMVNLIAWKHKDSKRPKFGKVISAADLIWKLEFDCPEFRSLSKKKQDKIKEFIINQPSSAIM